MIVRNVPIRNATSHDFTVCVEPWGERHSLQSGESLRLVFYGPSGGDAEIVVDEGDVSVYGWQSSQVFVVKDDICISQPSLVKVIPRLFDAHNIDPTKVDLEPDLIEYAQRQLDAAPAWDKHGREAAFMAVSRLAPLFRKLRNDAFVWAFCEQVLHSRGVFLRQDRRRFQRFIAETKKQHGKPHAILANWFRASVRSAKAAENVMED